MTLSNRARQHTIRLLQAHRNAASLAHGAIRTQSGFVELYQTNGTWGAYITPRKGVAVIPTRDVLAALNDIPQLATIAGLLAPQWFTQLEDAGLERAAEYPLLTYGALPDCDQPEPVTPIPLIDDYPIVEARNRAALELWLRLQGGDLSWDELDHMETAVQTGSEHYLLVADGYILRDGLMFTLQAHIAELRGGFAGLNDAQSGALVQAAVRLAQG